MDVSIIVPIITSVITLIGVCLTSYMSNKQATDKMTHKLEMNQAVTEERLSELTREVRLHNNFAQRIPIVEEQIKVINHRIEDLEWEEKNNEG